MRKNKSYLILFALLFLAIPSALRADDAAAPTAESRLREALRNNMTQLRDLQNQLATAQAAQTASDAANKDLQSKVDALTAQLKTLSDQEASEKAASEKSISDLKAEVTDETGQIARLNEGVKQWKDAYGQVAQLAAAKESERSKLAIQNATLQRLVDDREKKNFALYKVANEILTRYEQFGLGEAIGAKEPFVGITKVKLENLVQDYKDKILNQAITSGMPPPPAPPAPAPAPTKPAKAVTDKAAPAAKQT